RATPRRDRGDDPMSAAAFYLNPYRLPWTRTPDVHPFRRILSACIALVMLLSLLIPWLPKPPAPRFETKPVESTMRIIVEEPTPIVLPPPEEQIRPPKPLPDA